eukprot:gene5890-7335_t
MVYPTNQLLTIFIKLIKNNKVSKPFIEVVPQLDFNNNNNNNTGKLFNLDKPISSIKNNNNNNNYDEDNNNNNKIRTIPHHYQIEKPQSNEFHGRTEINRGFQLKIIENSNSNSNHPILNGYLIEVTNRINEFKNFQFYKNLITSVPQGNFIDKIHLNWRKDYKLLERHHGYVQWLFPLFADSGVNYQAQKLSYVEAELFRNDIDIAKRILRSYILMLEFYGMKLSNFQTGAIEPSNDLDSRFLNLSRNQHNCLRISRILTFLGHSGFKRYKKPFFG